VLCKFQVHAMKISVAYSKCQQTSPTIVYEGRRRQDEKLSHNCILYSLPLFYSHSCYENIYFRIEDHYPEILKGYLVKNEMGALDTLTKQQKYLPISVEQARDQVKRLKEQSRSTVKKGQNTANKWNRLRKPRQNYELNTNKCKKM